MFLMRFYKLTNYPLMNLMWILMLPAVRTFRKPTYLRFFLQGDPIKVSDTLKGDSLVHTYHKKKGIPWSPILNNL